MSENEPVQAHILAVDDEVFILSALKRVLTRFGYAVSTANSVRDGVTFLDDRTPDLVVTDLRLPGESGLDLAEEVRRRNRRIPVVLLTGVVEMEHVAPALEDGRIQCVLQKPWEMEELVAVLRRTLARCSSGMASFAALRRLMQASEPDFHQVRQCVSEWVTALGADPGALDNLSRALHEAVEVRAAASGASAETVRCAQWAASIAYAGFVSAPVLSSASDRQPWSLYRLYPFASAGIARQLEVPEVVAETVACQLCDPASTENICGHPERHGHPAARLLMEAVTFARQTDGVGSP